MIDPVSLWSAYYPYFWQTTPFRLYSLAAFGGMLALKILAFGSVTSDVITWKVWYVWTMMLYVLPALIFYTP